MCEKPHASRVQAVREPVVGPRAALVDAPVVSWFDVQLVRSALHLKKPKPLFFVFYLTPGFFVLKEFKREI